MKTHDIIVIGAGSGGLNVAMFMNKAGFKTLLIDKSDAHIGGDCLNYGCVPSKALIHVSRMSSDAKKASEFGLKVGGEINLKKVMQYVHDKQEVIRKHENATYFKSLGLDVKLGKAEFTGKNTVSVEGKEYSAKKIVIATGSRPRKLNIPGVDQVNLYDNESIFYLEKLPKQLLVIGGGPIGMEIAQAFNRLGSKVTIVMHGDIFLPKETQETAMVLRDQLEKEGIKFIFNASPKEFSSKTECVVETKDGKKHKIKFDLVFVGIGRVLNHENLGLEKAGIELDESGRKIKVDEYLRTTNPNVFLCGDIAGSYQFTHAAELHAGVILSNFFSPFKKKLNNDHLSWVTYTDPQIATFGINEAELKKRGREYQKLSMDFDEDDRHIVEDAKGRLQIYVHKGKILGGSMVAPNAGELIQELVLAMRTGTHIKEIFNKIYAYPVQSRVNKRIIQLFFANKLNATAKRILKFLY